MLFKTVRSKFFQTFPLENEIEPLEGNTEEENNGYVVFK
jgi:hypothetical protein